MHISLSIIIPIYNGVTFIERCLEAMLDQNELQEIICIDDGSADGSYELLLELEHQHPRIQVITHPGRTNKGASASRNLGINTATSTWITFCDIDDYFLPGRFEAFAKADKEGVNVFHTAVKSEYQNENLKSSVQEITSCPFILTTPKEMQNHLISQSVESISIISMIIRKDTLMKINLFDERLDIGEDTDLIWRLAGSVMFKYEALDPPKVIRQVHSANTYQNKEKVIKGRLAFYRKWRDGADYEKLNPTAKRRIREGYRHYRYVHGYEYGTTLSQTIQHLKYFWSKVMKN